MPVPALLTACATSAPALPPPGCGAAWDGTVASVRELYHGTAARQFDPTTPSEGGFPARAAYVERCEALGLDERQLGCLQPARALADPKGCAAALDPVRTEVDDLATWFTEHTRTP